jgi:tetratricopeptide (TPR) repeat protein
VPVSLRQGLRFIAQAQFTEPRQPDALLIRVQLLAGGRIPYWLQLAEKTLALAREVAPNHPRLPLAETSVYVQRGKLDAAITCYEQTVAAPPSPEEAYIALAAKAHLLAELKRADEALATYDQALALDPGDPWVWHNKAILLRDLGRYDEALACNDRALAIMDFGAARAVRESILAPS